MTQPTSTHRSNFRHLYADVIWYGVLAGSIVAFLQVYLARLGATGLQVGLLSSGPAVINLLLSLPLVRWLEGRSLIQVVYRTSIAARFFFLFLIPLPWLLPQPQAEVWAIIILTLLAAVPTAFLAIAFNSMFAEVVPARWRAEVVGWRNASLAVSLTVTTFICGWLLDQVTFPINYQLVFGIGVLGAAMTSFHLGRLKPVDIVAPTPLPQPVSGNRPLIRVDLLRTAFGPVVLAYLYFYFAQFLPVPAMPLFWVNDLKITDQTIGLGNGIYYALMTLGSMTLPRLNARLGSRRALAISAAIYGLYPVIVGGATGLPLFLIGSMVGGFGWGLTNGSLVTYLMERVPANDRPAHMAWHNVALNLGILVGSMGGAGLETLIGPRYALLIGGVFRVLASLVFWVVR